MKDKDSKILKQKTNKKKHKFLKFIGRFFLWLFSTILALVLGLYVFLLYINKGPSPYFRDLFVASAMESSAGDILVKIFLSSDEISDIQNKNAIIESGDITDPSLLKINNSENTDSISQNAITELANEDPDGDGIIVYDVHGTTYTGKMMVILDPSRVKLGTCNEFVLDGGGMTLSAIVEKYDAVAGINGGKYEDEIGLGLGGMPEGIVICNGQLLMGDLDTVYGVYGFTYDNVLVVGNMTASQALNMGVRDAVTFGPALITNGIPAGYSGVGSGLNPRTAIGQREDGAVLFLVIEGRKASSIGASMSDLINEMVKYKAVNAANLDGGMSSSMVYNGEIIVSNSNIRSDRRIPTAFIVERKDNQ